MLEFPNVNIVGAFFRGQDVVNLVQTLSAGQELRLEAEPENAFDANAIKAFFESVHIGYVQRETAAWLAPAMASGGAAKCIITAMVPGPKGATRQPMVTIEVADEDEIAAYNAFQADLPFTEDRVFESEEITAEDASFSEALDEAYSVDRGD